MIQLPDSSGENLIDELFLAFSDLLEDDELRQALGKNASEVMKGNRGATDATLQFINGLLKRA